MVSAETRIRVIGALEKLSLAIGKGTFESFADTALKVMREQGVSETSEYARRYMEIVSKNDLVLEFRDFSGQRVYGLVGKVFVAVKQSERMVWVSEKYRDNLWLDWGFQQELVCLTRRQEPKEDKHLILGIIGDKISYFPLEPAVAGAVCPELFCFSLRSQADKLANFGHSLCAKIYGVFMLGQVVDFNSNPLSALDNSVVEMLGEYGKRRVKVFGDNVDRQVPVVFDIKRISCDAWSHPLAPK